MPYQLLYSSRASRPLSKVELEAILTDARAGNDARDITGALVYNDGIFMQILEGEQKVVEAVMRSIAADTRHTDVKVFHAADVATPSFRSWHMAALSPSAEELADWTHLEGSVGIDRLIQHVEENTAHLPRILLSIVRALGEKPAKPASID